MSRMNPSVNCKRRLPLIAGAMVALPAAAHANVVWPGLVIGWSTLLWAIPVGLLLEYFVVQKWLLPNDAGRAVIVANIISALAGIVLFPLLASFAELVPQIALTPPEEWTQAYGNSYDRLTALALIPLAGPVSGLIEAYVMRVRHGLDLSGRNLNIVIAANVASTAVACGMAMLFLRG